MFINSHIFQIPIERKGKKKKTNNMCKKADELQTSFRTDRKKQAKYDCEERNKGKLIGVYP